ncbi:FSIP1 protein, partial [Upupa epops]|nr:FSIP1 protein [Upupa epops]
DITWGNLDKILRPASSTRASVNHQALDKLMELTTPEPSLPKVDLPVSLAGSHQRVSLEENKGNDQEKSDAKEVTTDQQNPVESTTFLQKTVLNLRGTSNLESGDDSTETQTLKFCESSQDKPRNTKAANSSNLEYSEETDVDPQIQAAIKKMNKLDTVLAEKHLKERAVKKQGKEMRAKLWEELQVRSVLSTGNHEETENTKRFLALISSWQDTANPSRTKEDEIYPSVFHTQINPEGYDCRKSQHSQDDPSEFETYEFLNQEEKTHSKSENRQDFIKKNIELAKDSGNQIVMLGGERRKLIELLKDIEDGTEVQDFGEDASGCLAPGEGYTPVAKEFHHLNEIDIKLQVLLFDGDLSAISKLCSNPSSKLKQEPLVYTNRNLEAVPGEKVLRDNKEQCDQQNRLKEIDHQLQFLERNLTEEQMGLSEEQLKTLLEECMQPQRTISNVTMPKSQESLSVGLSPPCYTSQDSTLQSTSTLSKMLVEDHIVGMLTAQEKTGLKDKGLCVNAVSEIPGSCISKTLAGSHLSKDSLALREEPGDLEGLQEMGDKSITEGYFMSRALNTKRLKKPSFLGDPLYCISMNKKLSTAADILSIPLQTQGGE